VRPAFFFELALRDGIRLGFRDVPFDVERRVVKLRLRLCQLGFRLIQSGLKRTGIDLEEHVVFVNERTFPITLFDQIPGDLRLDLCIHISIQRRHPLAIDVDIPFDYPADFYPRGLRGRRFLLGASGA
jgi:hypothetical protein